LINPGFLLKAPVACCGRGFLFSRCIAAIQFSCHTENPCGCCIAMPCLLAQSMIDFAASDATLE
jgi:hypothetical protein